MKNNYIILTAIMIFIVNMNCNSQVVFGTSHAVLHTTIDYGDSIKRLQTSDLKVSLNYETAEFVMYLKGEDLRSVDSTTSLILRELLNLEFTFIGNFDLEYIKTMNHPPLSFEVTGDLQISSYDEIKLIGKGELVHLSDGAYPCGLSLQFTIQPEDLNRLSIDPVNFESILLEIQQTVLEEDYD